MDQNAAAEQAVKNILVFVFVKTFTLIAVGLIARKMLNSIPDHK